MPTPKKEVDPSKDWIQTFSGLKFFPMDPDPSAFRMRDIAQALSNQCRFTGHCLRFYSVAEHSYHVSRRAGELVTGNTRAALEHRYLVRRWGLLHDASEAYLVDLARPVKHQPAMAPYRAAEKVIMRALTDWAGLPPEKPPEVKQADLELLFTEARDLMSPLHPDWKQTARGITGPLMNLVIRGEPPEMAKRYFYDQWTWLALPTGGDEE